jgi:hypothetical protein
VFNPTEEEVPRVDPAEHVEKALQAGYTLDQTSPFEQEKVPMDLDLGRPGGLQLDVPRVAISPA